MTVTAAVYCRDGNKPGLRGVLSFECCPRVGERILLRYLGVKSEEFVVVAVNHEPLMPNERALRAELPVDSDHTTLWLYVVEAI